MKKVLFALLTSAIIAQCSFAATTETPVAATATDIIKQSAQTQTQAATDLFNTIKNNIVNDVTNTVTAGVNSIKLANYKAQLEQKKKELEEVENSSTFAIIKYFKKASLTQKIAELEAKIEAIENENKATETKDATNTQSESK